MTAEKYVDLDGNEYFLADLDAAERAFVRDCRRFVRRNPDGSAFWNYWSGRIARLYSKRNLTRGQITRTPVWMIASDLDNRLAIKEGFIARPDYREELEGIIEDEFKTRRDFCKATGLSEAMLSHVLAGRKHLAIDTLSKALARIGYRLRIVACPAGVERPQRRIKPRRAKAG